MIVRRTDRVLRTRRAAFDGGFGAAGTAAGSGVAGIWPGSMRVSIVVLMVVPFLAGWPGQRECRWTFCRRTGFRCRNAACAAGPGESPGGPCPLDGGWSPGGHARRAVGGLAP